MTISKAELRVVAAVAVLLVAIGVLAIGASRHEPDVATYTGPNPMAPRAVPLPPTPAK
jgi:hypothetical protein